MVISLLELRHGHVVAQVETYVCAYTYVYAYVETRLCFTFLSVSFTSYTPLFIQTSSYFTIEPAVFGKLMFFMSINQAYDCFKILRQWLILFRDDGLLNFETMVYSILRQWFILF